MDDGEQSYNNRTPNIDRKTLHSISFFLIFFKYLMSINPEGWKNEVITTKYQICTSIVYRHFKIQVYKRNNMFF